MATRVVPTSYADIEAALTAAGNGDTISIVSGSAYANQNLSTFAGLSDITIANNTGALVTVSLYSLTGLRPGSGWSIDGGDAGMKIRGNANVHVYVSDKSGVTAENCTFEQTDAAKECLRVEQVLTGDADMECTDCTIIGQSPTSLATAAVYVSGTGSGDADFSMHGGRITGAGVGVHLGAVNGTTTLDGVGGAVTIDGCFAAVYVSPGNTSELDARFCQVYDCARGIVYAPGSGAYPVISVQRCVLDTTAGNAILATTAHASASVTVRGCWGDTVDRIGLASATWDFNGYRVLSSGTGGASDVLTAADPGFADMAGHDYTPAVGSDLIDAGYDTGDATDGAGDPTPMGAGADIGVYEYQLVDCGISDIYQLSPRGCRITFAASGGGSQVPTQADAEDVDNWSVTATGYEGLEFTAVSYVSDLIYDATINQGLAAGTVITIDASAITTDAGGLCDDPGTGTYTIAVRSYWVPTLTADDLRTRIVGLLPWGVLRVDDTDRRLVQVVEGVATEYAEVEDRRAALVDEADPRSAYETIDRWMESLGVPDATTPTPDTLAEQREICHARMISRGGCSADYLIGIAAALGITVTITSQEPYQSSPCKSPCRPDYPAASRFTFLVHAPTSTSAAKRTLLEAAINAARPTFALAYFDYSL